MDKLDYKLIANNLIKKIPECSTFDDNKLLLSCVELIVKNYPEFINMINALPQNNQYLNFIKGVINKNTELIIASSSEYLPACYYLINESVDYFIKLLSLVTNITSDYVTNGLKLINIHEKKIHITKVLLLNELNSLRLMKVENTLLQLTDEKIYEIIQENITPNFITNNLLLEHIESATPQMPNTLLKYFIKCNNNIQPYNRFIYSYLLEKKYNSYLSNTDQLLLSKHNGCIYAEIHSVVIESDYEMLEKLLLEYNSGYFELYIDKIPLDLMIKVYFKIKNNKLLNILAK